MKSLMTVAVSAFLSLPAFGQSFNLEVAHAIHDDGISVTFRTTQTMNQMCSLEVTDLEITPPQAQDFIGIPRPPLGKISFNAYRDPTAYCLQAFGPHSGNLVLYPVNAKESVTAEDEVAPGYYQVVINGEMNGILLVSDGESRIVEWHEIPQ